MSDATDAPTFTTRAVQPSKEAKRQQERRRRGPARTRKCATLPDTAAALVGWVVRVSDAPRQLASLAEKHPRRYLQLVRFIQFGCAVARLDEQDRKTELARVWARYAGTLANHVAFTEPPTPWEIATYLPIAVAAIARLGVDLGTVFPE